MKYTTILIILLSMACTPKGTLKPINEFDKNSNIEVFKYYFDDGEFVYISRFKDCPNVVTTTWEEQQGKVKVTKTNTIIFENDQIQVIQK